MTRNQARNKAANLLLFFLKGSSSQSVWEVLRIREQKADAEMVGLLNALRKEVEDILPTNQRDARKREKLLQESELLIKELSDHEI